MNAETGAGAPAHSGVDALIESLGGDREVARRLAQLFLGTYPGLLAALDEAMGEADLPALRRVAHDIRGSCAVFAAEPCMALARRIEYDLGDERFQDWVDCCAELRIAVERVAHELRRFSGACEAS